MQFTVPQFIEGETKILGPLGLKQLAYLIVAAIICAVFYFILPFALFVVFSIIVFGSGLALALLKIQNTPLPVILKNFIVFMGKPKVYLWQKKEAKIKKERKEIIEKKEEKKPKVGLTKRQSSLTKTVNKISIK